MKILFLSQGDGPWIALKLLRDGHDVSWVIDEDKYRDLLAGLLPPPLDHIEHPATYDLIVFDVAHAGSIADELRIETPVIGSNALAEKLEKDRAFGIEFMEKCGINVPPWQSFTDVSDAIRYLKSTKSRTVFKPLGDVENKAMTYVSKNADDMARYLEVLFKKMKVKSFLLQEFVEGTEVSTEGWFDGQDFYAVNHTLEEKKFLTGGIGPNTGCSGNLVWMPTRPNTLFERGLRRAKDALRADGFVGPIDLNTIVTEGEVYGLEWTPRFGYEGTCNLTRLIPGDFGEFLHAIATGQGADVMPNHPFAATIRLSVPPYPNPSRVSKYEGVPVNGIDLDHLDSFYLNDVRLKEGTEGELETVGTSGLIGAPIGVGDSPAQAFAACQSVIDGLQIPDLQYRNDVGKCCETRYEKLLQHGWLRGMNGDASGAMVGGISRGAGRDLR